MYLTKYPADWEVLKSSMVKLYSTWNAFTVGKSLDISEEQEVAGGIRGLLNVSRERIC